MAVQWWKLIFKLPLVELNDYNVPRMLLIDDALDMLQYITKNRVCSELGIH